jgi:hypothetical protein
MDTKINKTQFNLDKQRLKSDIRTQQQNVDLEQQRILLEQRTERAAAQLAERQETQRKRIAAKEDALREGQLHALINAFPEKIVEQDDQLASIKLDLDNDMSISDEDEGYIEAKAQLLGIIVPIEQETVGEPN